MASYCGGRLTNPVGNRSHIVGCIFPASCHHQVHTSKMAEGPKPVEIHTCRVKPAEVHTRTVEPAEIHTCRAEPEEIHTCRVEPAEIYTCSAEPVEVHT